jgi:uncharacterized membrane protein
MITGLVMLLAACPSTGDTADSPADPCIGAPVLSWESFGHAFLVGQCDTCHAATSLDRNGAPETVTFDTVEEAWAWRELIVESSSSEAPFMPPEGGVSDDDRQRLWWWLECGEPGT